MKNQIKQFSQFLKESDASDLDRQELANLGFVERKRLDEVYEIREAIDAEICEDPELERIKGLFLARLKELFAKFEADHIWDDAEMSRVAEEWIEFRMEDNDDLIDFAVGRMLLEM